MRKIKTSHLYLTMFMFSFGSGHLSNVKASDYVVDSKNNTLIASKAKKKLTGHIDQEEMAADDLMLQGKYSEATNVYKNVVAKHKDSQTAAVGLGMSYAKQFKLDAAEAEFNKILAKYPNNPQAHAGKAMVLFNRLQSSSTTVIKNRDSMLSQAESECKLALQGDPGMPEAHYYLGMIYKDQGKYSDSINEFNDAIKNDPRYSEAYSGRGLAQLKMNDVTSAMESFKKACDINSGNSTGHYGLGECYLRQGQLDQALKELNTSLYQNRNSAPVHLAMGQVYNAQGNNVAAIKEFQEAIRIKPENPGAYVGIAKIREDRGDLELSIAELRSGLELMPNNTELRLKVGEESLKAGKLDDAIKEFENVLSNNPQDATAAQGLTRAYYLKANREASGAFFASNEFEQAQTLIDKAVGMNPNNMELRLAQAKMRALSGTKVDLNNLPKPTNDGERIAYAEACLANNNFSEANSEMNTAINNAKTANDTFAIADLALMIKDLPAAKQAYQKGATYPDAAARANRGLDAVAKATDVARQDLTLASDLANKRQYASAIDKYNSAIYNNPLNPDSRYGLAMVLEKDTPHTSAKYREACVQLRAYLSLTPNLPAKEVEKINRKIENLEEKAYKLELKEKKARGIN